MNTSEASVRVHPSKHSRSSSCSPGLCFCFATAPGLTRFICKAAICLCAFKHKSFLMKYCAAFNLSGGSALVHTFHINPCISQARSFTVAAWMHSHTHRQQTEHQFQLYKIAKCLFLFKAVQITKELPHLLFLETSTTRISSRNLICTQCIQTSHLLPHEFSYQHFKKETLVNAILESYHLQGILGVFNGICWSWRHEGTDMHWTVKKKKKENQTQTNTNKPNHSII